MPDPTDPLATLPPGFKPDLPPQGLAAPPPDPNNIPPILPTSPLKQQAQILANRHMGITTSTAAAEAPASIREKNANAALAEARLQAEQNIPWPDSTVEFVAQGLASGIPITQLTGGFGMGSAGRVNQTKALNRLTEIQGAKGLTGEDQARQVAHFVAGKAAIANLEKQALSVQQSEQTTRENMGNFITASNNLPLQTGSPALNSVIQFGQKEIPFLPGHDQVAAMNAAHLTGTSEYGRVVSNSPTGAGVLTDEARREAQEVIAGNYSKDQKAAAWQIMQSDMQNRVKAIRDTLDQAYVNLTKTPGYHIPGSVGDMQAVQPTPQEILEHNSQLIHNIYTNASTGASPGGDTALSTTEQAKLFPTAYQAEHAQFLNQHKGSLTVPEYLEFRKEADQKYGMNEAPLDPQEVEHFVQGVNAGKISAAIPAQNVPLSDVGKVAATVSQNPIATGIENAANAGTMGAVDLAIGQEGREKQQLANKANWKSATLGDIAGSVVPILGLGKGAEAVLAKAGITPEMIAAAVGANRAKSLGAIGTNALYGGIRGFNAVDDDQGGKGALEGAGAGAVGGVAGEAIAKGAKPLLSDATTKALATLKGVDLTTLQRLGLGSGEASLAGLPFVHGNVQKSLESFNLQRANKALEPLGETVPDNITSPQARNNFVYDTANKAYEDIKPQLAGRRTQQFDAQIATLGSQANTVEKQEMLRDIKSAVNLAFDKNGNFDGKGYQAASKRLRAVQTAFANQGETQGSLAASDMSRVAGQAREKLKDLVAKQVPGTVADRLNAVEKTWAIKMQLEDATNRALASNAGHYSPAQAITTAKKFDNSVNSNMSARGKAPGMSPIPGNDPNITNELEGAQHIMGSGTVPAKASLKETAYATGIGGATGYASGGTVPGFAAGLGTMLYAPGIKRITQKALTGERPGWVQHDATRAALADTIRKLITGEK